MTVEALAVVADGYEALVIAKPDDHLGAPCVRVLADVGEAFATHATMLQNGAPQEETLAKLREAANAAQQEARFAVLALSTTAGSAPPTPRSAGISSS